MSGNLIYLISDLLILVVQKFVMIFTNVQSVSIRTFLLTFSSFSKKKTRRSKINHGSYSSKLEQNKKQSRNNRFEELIDKNYELKALEKCGLVIRKGWNKYFFSKKKLSKETNILENLKIQFIKRRKRNFREDWWKKSWKLVEALNHKIQLENLNFVNYDKQNEEKWKREWLRAITGNWFIYFPRHWRT